MFPCKPFLGCVTKSTFAMPHPDAMDYCQREGYINMDVQTLAGFKSIYEVFEEEMRLVS